MAKPNTVKITIVVPASRKEKYDRYVKKVAKNKTEDLNDYIKSVTKRK